MVRLSTSRLNMEDGRIDNSAFKHYSETMVGGSSGTNTGSAYTINLSNGNTFNLILDQSCTFTFSNPPASGTEGSFTLILKRGALASVTWPVTVKWPGGLAPSLTPITGQYDIFTFFTPDAGATWFGSSSQPRGLSGKLFSWGSGANGSLGLNSTANRSSPSQIGTSTDWASIASGAGQSLAIKMDGTLWSWGLGTSGQLGDGTATTKSSPVQVGRDNDWCDISAGFYNCLALKTNGTLWGWGAGTSGVIGDSTTINKSSPTQIGTLNNWSKIAASRTVNFAIKTDGTLWAWGAGAFGLLGDNTTVNKSSPVQIGALTTWSKIQGGPSSAIFGIQTNGTLWAWGLGSYGRLGLGDTANRSSPSQVGALTTWADASNGGRHTLATQTNGTLWAWGFGTSGQLGNNTAVTTSSPVQVGALTTWSKVGGGSIVLDGFSLASKTDGTLWAWGINTNGQLGQNNTTTVSSPVQIGNLTTWRGLDVGFDQVGGLTT